MISVQLAAGQLRGALLTVEGSIMQQPDHAASLASLGISAAWRLSDWGRVEQLTELAKPSSVAASTEVFSASRFTACHLLVIVCGIR